MKEKEIQFEQINTGSSEGMKRFRDFYAKYRKQMIRESDRGMIDLPVVVYQDNGNIRIHQGTDGLERFLGIK
jgi:hypothetical protein